MKTSKRPWSSFCPNQINRERKTTKFRAFSSSIYQIKELFSFSIQIFPHNIENQLTCNYSFCIKWFHLLHWNWWVQNELLLGEICNKTIILFLKLYGTKRRWKFKLKSDSGFSVSFGGIAFFGAFHVHWPSITTSRFIPEKLNSKASSFWITC